MLGPEATPSATTTLLNKKVSLITDPTQAVRDRNDLLLAYVYLPDGTNPTVIAASAGVARSYVFNGTPVAQHAAIAAAEQGRPALRTRGCGGPAPDDRGETHQEHGSPSRRNAIPLTSSNPEPSGAVHAGSGREATLGTNGRSSLCGGSR